MQTCKRSFLFPACMLHNDPFWRQTSLIYLFCFLLSMENRVFAVAIRQEVFYYKMTEAAFFTIGRSRTIGYGKIRPLADYRSRSWLFISFPRISNLSLICRFIHLQKLKISWKLELQWSMKLEWNLYFFF